MAFLQDKHPSWLRRNRFTILVGSLAAVFFAVFVSLGVWQLERRTWKLDLIAAVDARASGPAVAAPGPNAWPGLTYDGDEYRHVTVTGTFDEGADALVQATTDYGFGFWLMTPLETQGGFEVLVNRGFVPSREVASEIVPPDGEVTVSGLLRMSEPGGGFLRGNDPAEGRWYSRDVDQIAAANGIAGPVAPYFVDAMTSAETDGGTAPHVPSAARQPEAEDARETYPIAGLTALQFRNSHLVYALTWFALALLTLAATAIVFRRKRKRQG